ncbi:MAG TPA: flagellar protein [Syntrophomonadaceae bacterium]|nr:flagellar protein [Syntrophomonadaceae bacterium]
MLCCSRHLKEGKHLNNHHIYFPQQPVQAIQPGQSTVKNSPGKTPAASFDKILQQEMNSGLKFSRHARQRMQSRNIELDSHELERLHSGVNKAREKGSRDSLILMDNLALVVSVKNNTVITAVDGENLRENVFTNIDSAVIV